MNWVRVLDMEGTSKEAYIAPMIEEAASKTSILAKRDKTVRL